MSINIRVTAKSATLSCIHKDKMMSKEVQAMYRESFEVIAVLQNLAKALEAIKTQVPVTITLVGNDYIANVVKSTAYLKYNSNRNFKKPSGADIYMGEYWRAVFKTERVIALLENNLLTFQYEQAYTKNSSNWTGD